MALAGAPLEARAQVSSVVKPVQFGVALGAAIPMSAAYNQFSVKDAFGGGNAHFTSVTGNLVYKIPGATVSPYAIGGAGWYNAAVGNNFFVGSDSESKFGWNVGGGIALPLSGFDAFIEARYNQMQTDTPLKFIPITFGIMF